MYKPLVDTLRLIAYLFRLQVTTPIITSVTGGPIVLNGLGQVVRVEAAPQHPPVVAPAQEGLIDFP